VILGIVLIILTTLFYIIHFLMFRDLHHIFIYFIGDVAFVFFEVLLVTLVIHRLLHHRDRNLASRKRNMLIGAFFSEVGTDLLRRLVVFEGDVSRISQRLTVPEGWSERGFLNIREQFLKSDITIDTRKGDLEAVRQHLKGKKLFLLDLLLNRSLLENESFPTLSGRFFTLRRSSKHKEIYTTCRIRTTNI
jgi:hypothetical protein